MFIIKSSLIFGELVSANVTFYNLCMDTSLSSLILVAPHIHLICLNVKCKLSFFDASGVWSLITYTREVNGLEWTRNSCTCCCRSQFPLTFNMRVYFLPTIFFKNEDSSSCIIMPFSSILVPVAVKYEKEKKRLNLKMKGKPKCFPFFITNHTRKDCINLTRQKKSTTHRHVNICSMNEQSLLYYRCFLLSLNRFCMYQA